MRPTQHLDVVRVLKVDEALTDSFEFFIVALLLVR